MVTLTVASWTESLLWHVQRLEEARGHHLGKRWARRGLSPLICNLGIGLWVCRSP